ncbi:MAG: hypothetical protein NVS3B12_31260 [Acidimicrobiales bacterium]
MSKSTRLLVAASSLALVTLALSPVAADARPKLPGKSGGVAPTASTTASPGFTNFVVSGVPGVTCPGGNPCSNTAAEPAIRADNAGNFYGTSENGIGGGTIAVKSTDGGMHYTTLVSPDGVSASNNTGFAPGGGDTDLATAPALNPVTQHYNVYAASLSLANIDVSTSVDGGQTWKLNPVAATVPGDDREWIAADGASKVCISYHDLAAQNIEVNCSFDAGTTFTQLGDAIDPAHAFLINNNEIGNLAIDPTSHTIYQLFSGIASQGEFVDGELGNAGHHAVWVGVSTDGGATFTDYPVYVNPTATVDYGHQFVNVSLDRAGNAYALYSDNHNLSYSYSTDRGQTWSKPVQVNSGQSATAIMPWSVAGDAGKLDVVWYGTSFYSPGVTPDNYPSSAAWNVYFAQNLAATTPGSSFTQTIASPVNHYGGVCESGVGCTGNRDLYDDFGVAASPITGLASIIYSDDQASQTPSDPGCTAAQNNTAACDHTAIATQTGGSGIFGGTSSTLTPPPTPTPKHHHK